MNSDSLHAIKLALEQMIEGIQIVDFNWRYVYVNQAAAVHGRTTPEALIGRTMMECYPGIDQTPIFDDFRDVIENKTPKRIENEFEFPDKSKCWFELYIEPYSDGFLVRSIDITEKKNLENQLRHSQKMEAIGRLAGGIAHDFNNKLAIMLAYAEMLVDRLPQIEPSLETYAQNIIAAVQQSASLTRQLLAFSRKQVLDFKTVNLNELIRQVQNSLSSLIGEDIAVTHALFENLDNVYVDPAQIDQVILNLCVNARDAMPQGGKLLIETENVELDAEYCEKHVEVTPGRYVLMAFTDTGMGMSKEVQTKIFEPFFTTKEIGKGTGLGLATVHGIVKQSRGHIWVYSELGMGTTFKIYLPAVQDKTQTAEPAKSVRSSHRGDETIFLLEDDPILRQAYSAALEGAGYTVLSAETPKEALKLFSREKKIHLLLTDVVLPEMSGKQLAEELQKKDPALKVIFISGYTENSIVHHGILDTEAVLIQKPISINVLLESIRDVLEGRLRKGVL